MSMLSDYQRMVEEPRNRSYEATIASLHAALTAAQARIADLEGQVAAAERGDALIWFLRVIDGAGGEMDASEYKGHPLSVFCDDREPIDTFNLAINRGLTRSTHDTSFDTAVVYLTDAGRAFLKSNPPITSTGAHDPDVGQDASGVRR